MAVLKSPIKEKVEDLLFVKVEQEFGEENYDGAIKYLNEAWQLLPEQKGKWEESYQIAESLAILYLMKQNYTEAIKWAKILFDCDTDRIDSGEREFLVGKIRFEMGDEAGARKYFKTANVKSEGRCFEDEDTKYLKFFLNS